MDALSLYDYVLPEELIASTPLARRDDSRLLCVSRERGTISHHSIRDLPALLQPRDCLVFNDTRVIPARLLGTRLETGGKWEGLFLGTTEQGHWRLIGQTRGKLQPGDLIGIVPAHRSSIDGPLEISLLSKDEEGTWLAECVDPREPLDLLAKFGTVPLPPYIRRQLATNDDWERYQTTYARAPGAVAAPTAGLHFTPELRAMCRERGIDEAWVTLHVGLGTFRPVSVDHLSDHRMHHEWCEITAKTVEQLQRTGESGGRIVAVGTTTVRTLETAAQSGRLEPFRGQTDLFIRPPYEFRSVDCVLTNFHLPKSTLLVLVSALAGLELIREAYQCAIRERYRFFSYGDAMLIV